MQIIIQSPGFKASDTLEAFVNEKVGKLAHYSQTIIRADVTLFKGAETELENNYCEIRLEVPGNDLYAKNHNSSFEHAVTATVDQLKHILDKNKDKEISQRHADSNVATD